MKKAALDEGLNIVQSTLEQWLSFKKFLVKAIETDGTNISADDEANFLDVKSSVARNSRILGQKCKELSLGQMDFGEKTIRELLNKCVSVQTMAGLPENDKNSIYKDWHTAFVLLSRSVGAIKFMSEGYRPEMGAAKKKKGGGVPTKVIGGGIVVAILVIVGIAKFLGFF